MSINHRATFAVLLFIKVVLVFAVFAYWVRDHRSTVESTYDRDHDGVATCGKCAAAAPDHTDRMYEFGWCHYELGFTESSDNLIRERPFESNTWIHIWTPTSSVAEKAYYFVIAIGVLATVAILITTIVVFSCTEWRGYDPHRDGYKGIDAAGSNPAAVAAYSEGASSLIWIELASIFFLAVSTALITHYTQLRPQDENSCWYSVMTPHMFLFNLTICGGGAILLVIALLGWPCATRVACCKCDKEDRCCCKNCWWITCLVFGILGAACVIGVTGFFAVRQIMLYDWFGPLIALGLALSPELIVCYACYAMCCAPNRDGARSDGVDPP